MAIATVSGDGAGCYGESNRMGLDGGGRNHVLVTCITSGTTKDGKNRVP